MRTDYDRDIIELKNIFMSYKHKYQLDTELNIGKSLCSYFNQIDNSINIDNVLIKGNIILEDLIGEPRWVFLVRTLLHEIGHALDWKYNRKQMKKEKQKIFKNDGLRFRYVEDKDYHDSLPFEKRAINFAEKELHKWVGDDYDER